MKLKKNYKKFFSRIEYIFNYKNYLILRNEIDENENKIKKI